MDLHITVVQKQVLLVLMNTHCIVGPLYNHHPIYRLSLKVVLVGVKRINDCQYGRLVASSLFSLLQRPNPYQ